MSDDSVILGRVVSSHGIKGNVKILHFLEDAADFAKFHSINLDKKLGLKDFAVLFVKNNLIIVKFPFINSKNDADSYIGSNIWVERKDLPELESDELFYYVDLNGCKVYSKSDVYIGIVENVLNFGAGDILQIKNGDQEIFYSFQKDFVDNIDIKEKKIIINDTIEI